jgi:inorganic pyrophosphatase
MALSRKLIAMIKIRWISWYFAQLMFSRCRSSRQKLVGVMHMVDNGEQDDKIIAVAKNDMSVNYINDLNELPPHAMTEIVRFFKDYKTLEGKNVTIEHLLGVRYAHKVITESLELYKSTFPVYQS